MFWDAIGQGYHDIGSGEQSITNVLGCYQPPNPLNVSSHYPQPLYSTSDVMPLYITIVTWKNSHPDPTLPPWLGTPSGLGIVKSILFYLTIRPSNQKQYNLCYTKRFQLH